MRRIWTATTILAVLFAADLAATLHARLTWHPTANGPRLATLGQLAGFISSAILLLILAFTATEAVRATRNRRPGR